MFDHADPYPKTNHDPTGFQDRNIFPTRNGTSVDPTDPMFAWTVVTRFILTILLRIGFAMIQVGSVPVTNVNLILLHNILDFSCVTLIYTLAGHVIAYGNDVHGLMGDDHWIGWEKTNKEEAIVGWQAIIATSSISASCLIGRTHTVGYLFVGLMAAGVLQPIFIHWAWTPNGWMTHNSLYDRAVSFRDYGGSAVVHAVGGTTGLMGCLILGRRILRLRDIDDASVSADSAGTVFAGYLLVLLGLQNPCPPSTSASPTTMGINHTSLIITNNLLAASACTLVVVGLHFFPNREPFNHWTVMRCVQASVAGTVMVSAGVNAYTPLMCLGVGCSGGIVFYLVSRIVFHSALEDYCNIIATHMTCGIVGNIVAALFRNFTSLDRDYLTMILDVGWQVICLVAMVTLTTIAMTLAFGLLECLGLLRNRSEFVNHLRAVVALDRGPSRSFMQRLFYPDSETFYLQPGTAPVQRQGSIVSQRFARYELASNRIEQSNPKELVGANQRSFEPETDVASFEPSNLVIQTRIKKLRQIHTMRSISVDGFPAIVAEAMGDNRHLHTDASADLDQPSRPESRIQCSGDVAHESKTPVDSLSDKLSIFNCEALTNAVETIVKEQREPYRLHRTEKFMNLRLEAIREHDENVEFLIEPRIRSFSSTESDSEDEITNRCKLTNGSSCQNLKKSIQKTVECPDA